MTTLNLQVDSSTDDGFEYATGTTDVASNYIQVDASMWGGALWVAAVPQGATIDSATLQVYVYSGTSDNPVWDVYFEDADDAAAFSAGAGNYDISGRDRTTAKTDWDELNLGVGWESITVTDQVQEVVDRGSWASGNSMAAIAQGMTGSDCNVRPWDDSGGLGPKLDIDYSEGGVIVFRRRIEKT